MSKRASEKSGGLSSSEGGISSIGRGRMASAHPSSAESPVWTEDSMESRSKRSCQKASPRVRHAGGAAGSEMRGVRMTLRIVAAPR